MKMTGFVYNFTCPNCKKNFSVNADEYQSITEQITTQIEAHIRQEAKAEQEIAVKSAVNDAVSTEKLNYSAFETQVAREKAEFEKSISELQHKLKLAEQEKQIAIKNAIAEKEKETERLTAELRHANDAADMNQKISAEQTENRIRELKAQYQEEKSQVAAAAATEIAKRDRQIAEMQAKVQSADTDKQLAIKNAQDKLSSDLHAKEAEIIRLTAQLKSQEQEAKNQAITMKNGYEAALRLKDDEIERIKDFKNKLSTKALGESLEQYCQNQFNAIRTTAFPNAYFEKDNDARTGSKGDYIFREIVDGSEILSIMFDMKTEADQTSTKHKNEDFFKELDKDRREKKCEYAVLVSTLEYDNEFFNAGIRDVSYRYPKMYVVRPQQFITIISLLRNAALNSVEYQKELALIKSQQLDLSHFENNMNEFKDAFGRNYRIASEKLKAAVEGIDKNIASLQKIKDNLLSSENNLRLANDKAEGLSIKRLTKGAPSVAGMLAAAKEPSKKGESDTANNETHIDAEDKQHNCA